MAALVQPEAGTASPRSTRRRLYPSFEALLDDPTVDAVDICLPNDLHREFAVRALQAGKHVLCEKPIALTLEDADAMIAAARRAGRFLMIGHVLRFWPEYRAGQGAHRCRCAWENRWPCPPGGWSRCWPAHKATGAGGTIPRRSGGAVLDMQIHDLDAFCWFFGRARWPCSRVASARPTVR